MKNKYLFTIRKSIFNILYLLTKQYSENVISVLCFHSISDNSDRYAIDRDTFENEISKIAKVSKFISLKEAIANSRFNKSSVVITFDDGYRDILTILPIIKKYKIKATLFVLSDPKNVNRKELDNKNDLLTFKEIKYLYHNGIEIRCHSATHADLTKISKKELQTEIVGAKKILEKILNIKINYFAYPKGEYNNLIIKMVKLAGYKAAMSIDAGCITKNSNRWILPRTIIDKTHQVSEFPAIYFPSTFLLRKATNKFKLWERFLNV